MGTRKGAYDPEAAFTCDWPSADLIANYRSHECRMRSDEVLAVTPLSAAPRGLGFHHDFRSTPGRDHDTSAGSSCT